MAFIGQIVDKMAQEDLVKRGRTVSMKNGDEYDALTKWKKVFDWNPGERKWIKKGFNRRERRQARQLLTDWEEEEM